ncbi:MAG: glycoside hydrolase family 65 protein [Egibacteraceae bacterium]
MGARTKGRDDGEDAVSRRQPLPLPRHDYPPDAWKLVESRYSTRFLARTETLFALGNGYLGLRGNHDEGRPTYDHGTIINGFHETWPIVHAEEAYGLAKTGQTTVDVPDPKILLLYVDDEPLFLSTAFLTSYERVLDFRAGCLQRSLVWETLSGKRVRLVSKRLVSLTQRHMAAFSFEVTLLNADGPLVISSVLLNRQDRSAPLSGSTPFDPRISRDLGERVLENELSECDGTRVMLGYRTARSGMTLGCGMDHRIETACDYELSTSANGDQGKVDFLIEARRGEPIRVTKFATYHTSRTVPTTEMAGRCQRGLARALSSGFDAIAEDQRTTLDDFWDRCDIQVGAGLEVQQAVRWNLFQLMQATARAEGSGIPAKGVTGHGYEGHYFWDIEIFVVPFLCYTEPRIAKNLLRFRHRMLPAARERALELDQEGALFPWRTINGEEASAYYQAGTAQYHLNADIVLALKRYVDVSGDREILSEIGAEMLVETARLWADLGFHDDHDAFHLHSVTGPDEYTTVVNDNAYTNLMARLNLNYAVSEITRLRDEDPYRYEVLCGDVGLRDEELASWLTAARTMHVPYDDERGVIPQDAHFLEREVWDFANTPPQKYPLLLHYHPLVIYRHQVIKQADVILALFLLGNEFTREEKRRNFTYYDPLTTSDSSLSPPVHAIVAAQIGDLEKALSHFRLTLLMDLADVGTNAAHGVHVAAAGGTWMALTYGFAGLRDFDGQISFDPRLPEEWEHLRFSLTVAGSLFDVELTHDHMRFSVRSGPGLKIAVRDEDVVLSPEAPVEVALGPA